MSISGSNFCTKGRFRGPSELFHLRIDLFVAQGSFVISEMEPERDGFFAFAQLLASIDRNHLVYDTFRE